MRPAGLPEEGNQLLHVAERFAEREIAPGAPEADRTADVDFLRRCLDGLSALGLPSLLLPEDRGGAGLDPLTAGLCIDVIAHACASVAGFLAGHFAAQTPFLAPAPGAGISAGHEACVFPAANPPDAEDPAGLALEERQEGLVLHGTSELVAGAELASSFTVFARPRGRLLDGPITCVRVDAADPCVTLGPREIFSGLKALPFRKVSFRSLSLSTVRVSGEGGQAEALLDRARDLYLGLLAAAAMGVARNAFRKAVAYACDRYQYGKVIADHQEIQRVLGAMEVALNAGTALYGQGLSRPAAGPDHAHADGRQAKVFCTDACLRIVLDAIQVHGGYGYMEDYGVEKLMRDAKMLQLLGERNPVLQIEVGRNRVERLRS